uniref:Uncharacterized protein n=1 Tax=Amphimedon queenslandica TaxID=400682 RepID=A0A1X7TZF1_AMPQE
MSATQAGHDNRVSSDSAPTSCVEYLRESHEGKSRGKVSMNKVFEAKLQTSSSVHGGQKQISHVTHYSGNGIAGVLNGVPIPFQHLSAISLVHEKVDGLPVGQHPIITRLVKGVFNVRPPIPTYSHTRDLQRGKETPLSLKVLTLKTASLLAITRPSRSADLSQLNIARIRRGMNGVSFLPSALAKQSRQGKPIEPFYFAAFPANTILCSVNT